MESAMQQYPMFIDGKDHDPAGGEWFRTDDPFRGEPWAEIARGGQRDVDEAPRPRTGRCRPGPISRRAP
ncbi:carnitine dehydratase, partial [Lentzea sp. PSKA42]|nr:carnitine dehydratase [Lentzea indica]